MSEAAETLRAGVIGWPISHSLSPKLHGFWLKKMGIDGSYDPIAVEPDNLEDFIRALPESGLRGVNVTLPHKEAVLGLCDTVSETARRIGAVNTVIVGDDGEIQGDNTDAYGFRKNLVRAKAWPKALPGPAVVLGAGGAARAIAVALADMGYPEVRLLNRTRERAENLAAALGGPVSGHGMDNAAGLLQDAALLVNTTSLGMKGQPPLALDLEPLPSGAIVNDIVYNPLKTDLLARAEARGNPVVDGIGMLLHQAVPGFTAWFKPKAEPRVDHALRGFMLAGLD